MRLKSPFSFSNNGPILQRKCACGSKSGGASSCPKCGKDNDRNLLKRKATSDREVGEVPPIVYDVLRSSGQPLDSETRAYFEPRFGYDFSGVRVHTDSLAAQSAKSVNAKAYTVGPHIAFASGEYSPSSHEGMRLLAHELTHVRQQSGSSHKSQHSLGSDSRDSALEAEAEFVSNNFVLGATNPKLTADSVGIFRFRELTDSQIERIVAEKFPLQIAKAEEKIVARAAARATFRKLFWGQFWKAIVKRFALRGAVAAALSAADGPLPIGELISLGMLIWTAYEIVQIWDELEMVAQREAIAEISRPTIVDAATDAKEAKQPVKSGTKTKRKRECPKSPLPCPIPLPITWPAELPYPFDTKRPLMRVSKADLEWEGIERGTEQRRMQEEIRRNREMLIPPPQVCFDDFEDPNTPCDAHHIQPQYLNGSDELYNLCALETLQHHHGHVRLDNQLPHLEEYMECGICTPYLSQHPIGQLYVIDGTK
jgi:hypothetical protein